MFALVLVLILTLIVTGGVAFNRYLNARCDEQELAELTAENILYYVIGKGPVPESQNGFKIKYEFNKMSINRYNLNVILCKNGRSYEVHYEWRTQLDTNFPGDSGDTRF